MPMSLGSVFGGGGMPAQGTVNPGKMQTYFNSPYMAQIASNLSSAIYGDPRDALVQQQMQDMQYNRERQQQQDAVAAEDRQSDIAGRASLAASLSGLAGVTDPAEYQKQLTAAIGTYASRPGAKIDAMLSMLGRNDPRFQQELEQLRVEQARLDARQRAGFSHDVNMADIDYTHDRGLRDLDYTHDTQLRGQDYGYDLLLGDRKFAHDKDLRGVDAYYDLIGNVQNHNLDMLKVDDEQAFTGAQNDLNRTADANKLRTTEEGLDRRAGASNQTRVTVQEMKNGAGGGGTGGTGRGVTPFIDPMMTDSLKKTVEANMDAAIDDDKTGTLGDILDGYSEEQIATMVAAEMQKTRAEGPAYANVFARLSGQPEPYPTNAGIPPLSAAFLPKEPPPQIQTPLRPGYRPSPTAAAPAAAPRPIVVDY